MELHGNGPDRAEDGKPVPMVFDGWEYIPLELTAATAAERQTGAGNDPEPSPASSDVAHPAP